MDRAIKIEVDHLNFSYRGNHVLKNVSARFEENTITAIVGPSGIGKSTFLMTLNRLWETMPHATMTGEVKINLDGRFWNICDHSYPPAQLRRTVGMVFQVPNPLPMSIFKNVAFPLKLAGFCDKQAVAKKVEEALKRAYLWEEVRSRLTDPATQLSGGQQQRLCIARALILEPQILLLDEPTSSLDATAAAVIEELLVNLKKRCTILVVSHYLDQVQRIADRVLELADGILVPSLLNL
jgi:phosphate transport system ATP-binding protein